MIYIDTSVVLSRLFAEDRVPPDAFWDQPMVSSRLLEYETWVRVHARKLASSHGEATRALLGRVAFLELQPTLLARALEPFPAPVRTLDALHLASALFLRERDSSLALATYDDCLESAARAVGLPTVRP